MVAVGNRLSALGKQLSAADCRRYHASVPAERQSSRLTFPRRMRLSGRRQFSRVYGAKVRASAGPLMIYAAPNDLGIARLGLSVSRRVGTAVERNRIKRLLREAFRHLQHDWPQPNPGYDVVVSVRPHDSLELAEYATHLRQAFQSLHQSWSKKQSKPG
jgi:ribonuclease P protein component